MSKAESLPRTPATLCDSGSTSVCFPLLRVLGRFFNALVQTLLPMLVIFLPSSFLQQKIARCDCCVKQYLFLFLWKLLLAFVNPPQYWQADKLPFPTYQASPCRDILECHGSFHFLMPSNQDLIKNFFRVLQLNRNWLDYVQEILMLLYPFSFFIAVEQGNISPDL